MKEFKVVAASSNTNGFGLRGFVLIAKDGQAFEIGQHAFNPCVPVLEKGKTIKVPLRDGKPHFYGQQLGEITVTPLAKAPAKVVKEVW
jgi:hypothetical protein